MFDAPAKGLPAHRSREEIFSHPRFPAARDALIDAMLGLYEHEPFLNRLLLEAGRNVVFVVLMCLHARYDEAEPATWPTLRRLNQSMASFGLSSPRRTADLVSRLIKTGYLQQASVPSDRRVRILQPTARMIEQDLDWLVSHYAPLQALYSDPGYGPIMQRDRAFQQTHRQVSIDMFPRAAQLLARNPAMVQFMVREAGIMILIKLLQLARPEAAGTTQIHFTDIGARFGVSRTQVRKLLEEAERQGLVRLTRGRGQTVQLTPALVEVFGRFVADTMEAHDLAYQLAQRRTAAGASA